MKYYTFQMKYPIMLLIAITININVMAINHVDTNKVANSLENMPDSLTLHLKPWRVSKRIFNINKYGAKNDGKTINTKAIQRAIDACTRKGGGKVVISEGDYVTGTIVLKSNVILEIFKGARLLGSLSLADYPNKVEGMRSIMRDVHKYSQSLIYAEKATNIGICGEGEIYFRGEKANFPGQETIGGIKDRPFGIRMIQCSNIVIKDITLRNSAAWMQNYLCCDNLIFDNMTVLNHGNYNNDGIDPDGCSNVIIRNCHISSEDDTLCLKTAGGRACENILIENCVLYSTCNAFKFGTDTHGNFRNIIGQKLTLGGFPDKSDSFRGRGDCSTGITIETVDGGNIENIMIENVNIDRARCPIFLYIADRSRTLDGTKVPAGYMKDIVIRNVKGKNNGIQGSLITGIPEKHIQDVYIGNVYFQTCGGGEASITNKPVPVRVYYPDAQDFSRNGLPSYGFYIRYVDGIVLDNVSVQPVSDDRRPCFKVDNSNASIHVKACQNTPR